MNILCNKPVHRTKSLLFFVALLCAVTLSISSAPSATNAANAAKKERAVNQGEQDIRATPKDRSQPKHERRRKISDRSEDS